MESMPFILPSLNVWVPRPENDGLFVIVGITVGGSMLFICTQKQ